MGTHHVPGGLAMILRRITENLRTQNWTAIGIEFLIVVIGVFLGTQVATWNQELNERRETERMLVQLVPELHANIQFFDSARAYYAVTRRFADQALAAWENDPRVDDKQFVIAAYQASQIYGLSINAENWALTFGGEQVRDMEDTRLRRNLELVLTQSYDAVDFDAVATPYREQIRRIIPVDIQEQIRRRCGDRSFAGREEQWLLTYLPAKCPLELEPAKAKATAAALRARADLVGELAWHLSSVTVYLDNAALIEQPIRALHRDLTRRPR